MKSIWWRMHDWEGEGDQFPASLSVLTDAPVSLFVCPNSGRQPGAITDVDAWTDYIYVPSTHDWMRLDLAVLVCPPENHGGKYGHVIFGDGWGERLPAAQVRALIKERWCRPTPGRRSIGIYLGPNGTEIPFVDYARTNVTVSIPQRFQAVYRP
ncbi:MAG: hypothetical protein NT154_19945 [Verrucomicrobia bacterium]|nr:hypothetical protein [Verrucomicrobiota bacterium]